MRKIEYIVQAKALTKTFGGREGLNGINLNIKKGHIVGLLGSNGSGKSTFIKICSGLLRENSGEILINGLRPSIKTKEIVSYLPERSYLSDWMKVYELVDFFHDFYADFERKKAFNMLDNLNIDRYRKIKTLSKGTKEKLQLVLVMSRNAKLYLLDEPIAGVDPVARDYILDTIIGSYNKDSTIIISTHLILDIEKILDEVIFLHKGELLMHKSIDDIREVEGKSINSYFKEIYKC